MESKFADSNFQDELLRLVHLTHHQPHSLLGLHPSVNELQVIRLWRPGAAQVFLEVFGSIVEAKKVHEAGLFEYVVPKHTTNRNYRVYHPNGLLAFDPYTFLPTFGEIDQHLFAKGVHYELYNQMGGRLTTEMGVKGAKFNVWAPNARSVSVIGDFNHWDGRANPMRSMGYSGVWELFIPGLGEWEKYKFEIHTQQGSTIVKADPYALAAEIRPNTASLLTRIDQFHWEDQDWLSNRSRKDSAQPLNIYEVHSGSWKKNEWHFLNYREMAHQLASYCVEMGYTHVELMPIQEHPLDESWGYQVSGFFAPTSRHGSPEDFQYLVNHLHKNKIGVILDWVPGHFPTDDFSIGMFDGSALYEHADPRQGFHPHWQTNIFNFGRHEVSNFLIANALFWFEKMHVDGLRVDAVASMLYLDYGREEGEWIPNQYGGKENLAAIEFMKHLNSVVHERTPGVLMIAEESTSFPGVTAPVFAGGLGFDYKWNMGWMNDTLRYFSRDCLYRRHHHNDLTFGLIYAFSEQFICSLSHDEVVHGKKSLLSKMPGDMWQQFANLRLLISYMMCQPGKKLLFMGGEIGQWNEWNCRQEVEWFLLQFPLHQGMQRMVKDINHFYLDHRALWEWDSHYGSFQWVDFNDIDNSVISYLRLGKDQKLLCIHHFCPKTISGYVLHFSGFNQISEVFNTDAEVYGGSGRTNQHPQIIRNHEGGAVGVRIDIAPLSTMIFQLEN